MSGPYYHAIQPKVGWYPQATKFSDCRKMAVTHRWPDRGGAKRPSVSCLAAECATLAISGVTRSPRPLSVPLQAPWAPLERSPDQRGLPLPPALGLRPRGDPGRLVRATGNADNFIRISNDPDSDPRFSRRSCRFPARRKHPVPGYRRAVWAPDQAPPPSGVVERCPEGLSTVLPSSLP